MLTVVPIHLPVELDAFPGIPRGILAGHGPDRGHWLTWVSAANQAAAAPWWPSFVAARSLRLFDQSTRAVAGWLLPPLVGGPGRVGPAVYDAIVATLRVADEIQRLVGVDPFLTLAARDDFDTALVTSAALDLLARGELRLARSASAWEKVGLPDDIRAFRPVCRRLDAACAVPMKPAGLADLVAFYGRYAAADPDAVVPPALATLAGARGSSKSAARGRREVELLTGVTR